MASSVTGSTWPVEVEGCADGGVAHALLHDRVGRVDVDQVANRRVEQVVEGEALAFETGSSYGPRPYPVAEVAGSQGAAVGGDEEQLVAVGGRELAAAACGANRTARKGGSSRTRRAADDFTSARRTLPSTSEIVPATSMVRRRRSRRRTRSPATSDQRRPSTPAR